MLDPQIARRWYLLGVVLSVVAMVFAVVSHFDAHLGYPAAFAFTMLGVTAVSAGSWPSARRRLIAMNLGVLASQLLVMYSAMGSTG